MYAQIICLLFRFRVIFVAAPSTNGLSQLNRIKSNSYCIMPKLKQRVGGATGIVGAWKKKNMVATPADDIVNGTCPTAQSLIVIYQGRRWGMKKHRSGSKQVCILKSQINQLRGQITEAKATEAATSCCSQIPS